MKKVILFGATGHLGKAVAKALIIQNYDLTVVVRNEHKAKELSGITTKYIVADVCNKRTLQNICKNQEIVISTLGKSVSPNDNGKPSFRDVDFDANSNILEEAITSNVAKFVYISAFRAEKYLHLDYFKVHHDFAELLKQSPLNYSIIKPPAIFSAFIDMMTMAKKGQLVNIGLGNKKTNPIFEGDLAKVIVNSINENKATIEVGGKKVYTRAKLNKIIQQEMDSSKKIWTVPIGLIKLGLPFMKIFSKNAFDKLAFFVEVMQHDTVAPLIGEMTFEDYVKMKNQ
jgi:uncharacterized protein YbjT (DUF2867 family)